MRRRLCLLSLLLPLLLLGCAGAPRAPQSADPGAQIANNAVQLLGAPYHFGGADSNGFDCSGLAVYVHERAGLKIPRTAEAQSRAAVAVAPQALRPGDLVFFAIQGTRVNHVGIYAGAGRFVHAPRSGAAVTYGELGDDYFRKYFRGAGRFWNAAAARMDYVASPR